MATNTTVANTTPVPAFMAARHNTSRYPGFVRQANEAALNLINEFKPMHPDMRGGRNAAFLQAIQNSGLTQEFISDFSLDKFQSVLMFLSSVNEGNPNLVFKDRVQSALENDFKMSMPSNIIPFLQIFRELDPRLKPVIPPSE